MLTINEKVYIYSRYDMAAVFPKHNQHVFSCLIKFLAFGIGISFHCVLLAYRRTAMINIRGLDLVIVGVFSLNALDCWFKPHPGRINGFSKIVFTVFLQLNSKARVWRKTGSAACYVVGKGFS